MGGTPSIMVQTSDGRDGSVVGIGSGIGRMFWSNINRRDGNRTATANFLSAAAVKEAAMFFQEKCTFKDWE